MGRLYVLAVLCPRCGWRPSKRVTEEHRAAVAGLPADTVLDTVKCQHTTCGHVYPVPARAYHAAREAAA